MRKFLSLCLTVFVLLALCACGGTDPKESAEVKLHFVYKADDIHVTLTEEEATKVVEILDRRSELGAISDCLFSKDVCLAVDGFSYAIAMDGCNTLLELESGKYFSASEEDMSYLRSVFEAYGGHFH